jgi:hypothetical protein
MVMVDGKQVEKPPATKVALQLMEPTEMSTDMEVFYRGAWRKVCRVFVGAHIAYAQIDLGRTGWAIFTSSVDPQFYWTREAQR